jgi:hypothetical protein
MKGWVKSLIQELMKTRLGVAGRYMHVLDTPRARFFFSLGNTILAERTRPGVQVCRRMAGVVEFVILGLELEMHSAKQGLTRAQHAGLGYCADCFATCYC